jgi:hypothetical protein
VAFQPALVPLARFQRDDQHREISQIGGQVIPEERIATVYTPTCAQSGLTPRDAPDKLSSFRAGAFSHLPLIKIPAIAYNISAAP